MVRLSTESCLRSLLADQLEVVEGGPVAGVCVGMDTKRDAAVRDRDVVDRVFGSAAHWRGADVGVQGRRTQQYGMPLMMGLMPDVDKGIETYRKQLEAAGVNDLLKYVQDMANAHFDEIGVK